MLPKIEPVSSSSIFTNDHISADQGIIVKSENRNDTFIISPQVLNEIRPVHQSDIPGYERDAIEERQLAALGEINELYH
jgi:hypothetical protein